MIDSRPFYKKIWPGRPGFIFYFLFSQYTVNVPSWPWRMSNSYRHVFWQSTPHPASWRKWHDTWRLTRNKDDTHIFHVSIAKKQKKPAKSRELPPSVVPRREMVEIVPRWKYQSPPGLPSGPMLCSDTWMTVIRSPRGKSLREISYTSPRNS